MMSDKCNNKDDTDTNGRIWLHSQYQNTPRDVALSSQPAISRCPLPISTPRLLEDKLHHLSSKSSSGVEEFVEKVRQSKADFYKSQFNIRVTDEDRKRIERLTVESPNGLGGKVDVTIYYPEISSDDKKLDGICLHCHGGGWIFGDSYHQVAHRCLEMAQSLNVAVVSVEYSLFTQVNRHTNSFNPIDDVLIAIDWVESKGVEELNAQPCFIASGESSGAHVLLLAVLRRRDRDNNNTKLHPTLSPPNDSTNRQEQSSFLMNWKCLNLVYGVFDLSGTPSIHADGDTSAPLCGNDLLWMYDLYFSKAQQQQSMQKEGNNINRQHPSISPLYANLSHMPPALLSIGTADPLLDDTLFMANKYSAYGNNIELAIYEGGEHGIGHFGIQEDEEMGTRARQHTLDFMKKHLTTK